VCFYMAHGKEKMHGKHNCLSCVFSNGRQTHDFVVRFSFSRTTNYFSPSVRWSPVLTVSNREGEMIFPPLSCPFLSAHGKQKHCRVSFSRCPVKFFLMDLSS
jgi:hypothetical protein